MRDRNITAIFARLYRGRHPHMGPNGGHRDRPWRVRSGYGPRCRAGV